jgi:hypothetical protein
MAIGLQGTWSVSVQSKNAAWPQRFIVAGSSNGADGTYSGVTTTPAVLVTGDQWGVTIQNNPTGPISWRDSRAKLANFRVDGGFFRADIESDDGGGGADEDFNDLVLTVSKPLSESEWIVYGTAKSYKGFCRFNPCFPYPWVVVDTALQLERLIGYPEIRPIFERVYGPDVATMAKREKFTPLVLSRGGSPKGGLSVVGRTEVEMQARGKAKKASLKTGALAEARVATLADAEADITLAEARLLDRLKLIQPCESEPIAQALLRFMEYDRTDSELGGGAYTGFGDRETLGVAGTDEFGNYVFSFTRTLAQLIDEAIEDAPSGSDPSVEARPDLIIQFVNDPAGIAVHETAPYYNIPNVRRINLCIPVSALVPKPCRGDRVLQYLGDIPIINNPGSTLHFDGTVTNTAASESGPAIERGAWNGLLDIFGCFESSVSPVTHYTIRYRAGSGGWNYLSVPASGLRQQGNGTWTSESYGATPTALSVGTVPAYRNIELETGWSLEVEHRKARVNLVSLLTPGLARMVENVWFVIRGYDSSGDFVPGTYDSIMLRVDAEPSTGDIDAITVPGGADPGDCGMLTLPTDTTSLNVRLRALDPDGFLRNWSLSAVKGSNNPVGLTDNATAAAPGGTYPGPVVDTRFYGTSEEAASDPDGYVTLSISPPGSGWLEAEDFCAFSFELHVRDRTTNGKTTAGGRKVWDEVIGFSSGGGP